MSQYDRDSMEISRIQFHTELTQKEKNKAISKIEKRMEKQEALELSGKGNGYYE